MPPIHIPLFFEAAILSRIRSLVTSRSNCEGQQHIERQPSHANHQSVADAEKGKVVTTFFSLMIRSFRRCP
jgi:hypothetical protein